MEIFTTFTAVFLSVVLFIIEAVVAIHILLNKREESVSALLWLVVVFTFPVIGILLYLLFGINRIQTLGLKISLANELMTRAKKDNAYQPINRFFEEQFKFIWRESAPAPATFDFNRTIDRLLPDTVPLSGNKVELLQDGNMAYPRMLEAIENAKSSIHLESFIIMDDETGTNIFDALEKKAESGVEVKVIYDKLGSAHSLFSRFFKTYGQVIPNFKVVPFAHSNLFAPWRIQLRNHRKLLITDGKTAFVGGINISSSNIIPRLLRLDKDKYIHDLHCRIEGPVVGQLQFSFLRDWCYAARALPADIISEDYFPVPKEAGESIVRIIDSGPGQNYQATEYMFFAAVSTAQKSIWLMTPYFVPDKSFVKALCIAVSRGIEIRIIVPEKNNHWYVHYASHSYYRTLLNSGVRIFEKGGAFSHAKALLIDGEWAYMGSSNCDVRSFRLNYELDFAASKGEFLDQLHNQFQKELAESNEIQLSQVLKKPLHTELLEDICSLLTPIL